MIRLSIYKIVKCMIASRTPVFLNGGKLFVRKEFWYAVGGNIDDEITCF